MGSMLEQLRSNALIRATISSLRSAIERKQVYRPSNIAKFIFLCGANKAPEAISERRRALIAFAERNLPHTQFFLAEKMFAILQKEGHRGNLLDIEHQISLFSDHVVLVLESPSAFAELGAFSHNELRKKLIVINDVQYKDAPSFINLGPIKAVQEATGDNGLLLYPMHPDGVTKLDAIGSVYAPLFELLKEPVITRRTPIAPDACNPAKTFDKISAMFLHDVLYMIGPAFHREMIEVMRLIFGDDRYDQVREHFAILSAIDSVSRREDGLYRTSLSGPYLRYGFDINKVIAAFRISALRNYPERLYGT
ncbi:MAG: retron St85 family effector protein [Gammaproteobacteria bacterium]